MSSPAIVVLATAGQTKRLSDLSAKLKLGWDGFVERVVELSSSHDNGAKPYSDGGSDGVAA